MMHGPQQGLEPCCCRLHQYRQIDGKSPEPDTEAPQRGAILLRDRLQGPDDGQARRRSKILVQLEGKPPGNALQR